MNEWNECSLGFVLYFLMTDKTSTVYILSELNVDFLILAQDRV